METGHRPRIRARWLIIGTIIANLAIPTAVLAAGGAFTDDDTSVFETDIEWLAASGVTQGCNPPDNTLFCPEDEVTRGQMAAFMRRFAQYIGAEDGTPAEADNADTLDGLDSTALVSSGIVVRLAEETVADGVSGSVEATCAEGEVIIGGGGAINLFADDVPILSSRPADGEFLPPDGGAFTHWRVTINNPAGGTGDVIVRSWAICSSSSLLPASVTESGISGP